MSRMLTIFLLIILGAPIGVPLNPSAAATTFDQNFVQERLQSSVRMLAHNIGPRTFKNPDNLNAAAEFIIRSLETAGYDVGFHTYDVQGQTVRNIIVELPGTREPEHILIVGAHYDTAEGTPGADDNASGIAVLLEVARLHARTPFRKTVRFIAFTLEEPPFFRSSQMGSRMYAKNLKARGELVEAMICLEMVGYFTEEPESQSFPFFWLRWMFPTQGNFITVVSNYDSTDLQETVRDALKGKIALPVETFTGPWWVPGVDLSDHGSFWNEGYSAVMLTDTAFYRNPHYHRPTDTPEKLNYEAMAQLVEGMSGVLHSLDRVSKPSQD